jgi:hypothetical protein
MDVIGALHRVVDALEHAGIEYAIVGSVAAGSWGVLRMTRDADLIALINADQLDTLFRSFRPPDFYIPEETARFATEARVGFFNIIDSVGGGKVDIFVADSAKAFDRSRLDRRARLDVFGRDAWVATAEDVVLAKLRWRLENRSEVQWRDCVEIAASNELDWPYLWRWAAGLGVDEDLAELEDSR